MSEKTGFGARKSVEKLYIGALEDVIITLATEMTSVKYIEILYRCFNYRGYFVAVADDVPDALLWELRRFISGMETYTVVVKKRNFKWVIPRETLETVRALIETNEAILYKRFNLTELVLTKESIMTFLRLSCHSLNALYVKEKWLEKKKITFDVEEICASDDCKPETLWMNLKT